MLRLKGVQFYILCPIPTINCLLFNQLLSSTSFFGFTLSTLYIRSLLRWIFNLVSMLYLCILFRRRNFFSSYNLEILTSRCIVSNLKKSSWNVGEKFSSLSMTTTPLPHHDGGGGFFFLCPFLKKYDLACGSIIHSEM